MALTRENKIIPSLSQGIPQIFFTDILHYSQYKIKSQFFSYKAFKGNWTLAKAIWNAPLYLPNFSDITKKVEGVSPWSIMFYDSFLCPVCVSIRISAFWDPENIGPKHILFYSTKKRETFFFSWSLRDYIQ